MWEDLIVNPEKTNHKKSETVTQNYRREMCTIWLYSKQYLHNYKNDID